MQLQKTNSFSPSFTHSQSRSPKKIYSPPALNTPIINLNIQSAIKEDKDMQFSPTRRKAPKPSTCKATRFLKPSTP